MKGLYITMGLQYSVETYLSERFELPDGGRFSELVAGELMTYQPPDTIHGDVIFNLTKQLGNYLQQSEQGYACYDLGLVTIRNPDTIRFPAVSLYVDGERFGEIDAEVAGGPPAVVIEVASTNDRRVGIESRITEYHRYGIEHFWVVDPHKQEIITHQQQGITHHYGIESQIDATAILPDLRININTLFQQPGWIQ